MRFQYSIFLPLRPRLEGVVGFVGRGHLGRRLRTAHQLTVIHLSFQPLVFRRLGNDYYLIILMADIRVAVSVRTLKMSNMYNDSRISGVNAIDSVIKPEPDSAMKRIH
jgi:hypothetical protein